MRHTIRALLTLGLIGTVVSCAAPTPPSSPASAAAVSAPTPPAPAPVTFVNRVWRVADATAVAPGQLYVFLSEGTLVMTSPSSTPSLGTWRRAGNGFTMVEEGRPYRVDILALTDQEFRIRSHNPGQPVDIRLVPATGAAETAR